MKEYRGGPEIIKGIPRLWIWYNKVVYSKKEKRSNTNLKKLNKMRGYIINIEKATKENENFRKVLYTAKHSQLVLMSLKPGEEIGMEVHPDNDQFFRIEKGVGKCIIDGNVYELNDGAAIVVPAGSKHNVINTSDIEELKLYTIYSPPHHKDGIIRATKEEAEAREAPFDSITTE